MCTETVSYYCVMDNSVDTAGIWKPEHVWLNVPLHACLSFCPSPQWGELFKLQVPNHSDTLL